MGSCARGASWSRRAASLFIWFELSCQLLGFLQIKGLSRTQAAPVSSVGDAPACVPFGDQGRVLTEGWKPLVEAGIALRRLSVLQLAGPGSRRDLKATPPLAVPTSPQPFSSRCGLPGCCSGVSTRFREAETETPREGVEERTEACARARCVGASAAPPPSCSNDQLQQVKLQLPRSLSTHPVTRAL